MVKLVKYWLVAIPLVACVGVAGAEDETDDLGVTMTVIEDARDGSEREVVNEIELPEFAAEEARSNAEAGNETANEARQQGREFGQSRADEARDRGNDRPDNLPESGGRPDSLPRR